MGLLFSSLLAPLKSKSKEEEILLLRERANELYEQSRQVSLKSQQEYRNGNKKKAHELSQEKKRLIEAAETKNREAAKLQISLKNDGRETNELDLHGLYVKEALSAVEYRLKHSFTELVIITGKGNHSQDQQAKIKPAIIEYLESRNYFFIINSPNEGCITVSQRRQNKPCIIL
jgi:DNA-nicking Smr family endonuclease